MLPSIPVSPLIQQSLSCASLLADITQKSNQQQSHIGINATTTSSPSSLSTLEQDAKEQRTRLDQLTQQMYAVRAVIFHQWHPNAMAKQIVIVDSQLFCHHGATALNDFHTYLMHSLAHQLIIANSYAAFDHAVRLAHCLSQYRDWNGLMAVVKCLALPSVQRLSTSSASPLCHDFPWVHHDNSTTTTTNDTSFAAYRQAFRRSLLPLRPYRFDAQDRRSSDSTKKINHGHQDTSDRDLDSYTPTISQQKKRQQQQQQHQQRILVAIPWLPPLLEAETEHDRDLLLTLCRYNRWPSQVDVARSLLLPTSTTSTSPSSPSSTTSSYAVSSTTMLYSTTSSSISSLSPLRRNNNLPPILPSHSVVDLLSLGVGDLVLQHWLVSRTYLTLDQLLVSSQLAESDLDARLASSSSPPLATLPSPQHLLPSSSASSASSSDSSSADAAVLRDVDPGSTLPTTETLHQDYDDGQDWRNQTIPYNDDDEDDDDDNDDNVDDKQGDDVNADPWHQSNNRNSLLFVNTNDEHHATPTSPSPLSPTPDATKDQGKEIPSISVASSIPLSVTATTMPISQLDQLGTSTMYDGDGDDVCDDDEDDDDDDSSQVPISDKKNDDATTADVSRQHDDMETSDNRSLQSEQNVDEEKVDEVVDDDTVSKVSSLSPPQHDADVACDDQQAMDDVEIVVAISSECVPATTTVTTTLMADDSQAIVTPLSTNTNSLITAEPQFDHDEPRADEETDSEQWTGYPGPDSNDDDGEVWTGYPEPTASSTDDDVDGIDDGEGVDSPHRSTPSEASEDEWKGYQATSEEAEWQAETILKVQQQEWQGYTLETLDEDELDSSTMMNGEFVKSRHARELVNNDSGTSV
ncbi:unnamed protein product [Absidia cylindrospora]